VSSDLGAIIEPLSVAIHGNTRASLRPSARVFVVGAGAVGLLVAAVAKAKGAASVVIADIQKERLDFAVANGFADASILVPMQRPQTIEDKLAFAKDVAALAQAAEVAGQAVGEFDAVFECTGVETCVQTAIYVCAPSLLVSIWTLLTHAAVQSTKPGGKVLIIGMGTPILTLPMSAAALREVDLVGVFRYANTYGKAIELLSNRPAGMPDLSTIVTQRFKGMENITDAFAMAGKVKDGEGNLVIKVMVDFSE
jgi:L-iditol 2-dehydrogenase